MTDMMHSISFFINRIPLLFIVLNIILLFTSWMLSTYIEVSVVRNPLNIDGVRWMVGNFMQNIGKIPLPSIVFMLMGISVVKESGMLSHLQRRQFLSLKQRRAIFMVVSVTIVYFIAILLVSVTYRGILYDTFGDFTNSPMCKGWILLVFTLLYIQGNIYGYSSGRFVTFLDAIEGHTKILVSAKRYFLTAVCGSMLMCTIEYTGILLLSEYAELLFVVFYFCIYYLTLFLHLKYSPRSI